MGSSTLLEHHGMAMADSPLPRLRGDAKRSVLQLNKRAGEEEGEEYRFQALKTKLQQDRC